MPSPMKNLVIESHGDRDVNVYRRFTSSDIEASYSLKSDPILIHTGALWASFEEQTLLSFVTNDF